MEDLQQRVLDAVKIYRYLAERPGSRYRELFVGGTSVRAQSLVSDMENEGLTPEEVAASYRIPVTAVLEALDYVHAQEEFLAGERARSRQSAMAKGYLKSSRATPETLRPCMNLLEDWVAVTGVCSSYTRRTIEEKTCARPKS